MDKSAESMRQLWCACACIHRAAAVEKISIHGVHSTSLRATRHRGKASAAHRANSCHGSAPVWYVWPKYANRPPMASKASSNKGTLALGTANAPTQVAANTPCSRAKRPMRPRSSQLAATQKINPMPSKAAPSTATPRGSQ